MKFRLLLAALLSFSTISFAQFGPPGGMGKGSGMPKMGKIYGKVVDSKTGKPVFAASITLLQAKSGKDVLVKGSITESNGEFSLEELPMMGQFKISVSSVGYKTYTAPVAFDMAALMKAGATMSRGSGGGDAGAGMTIPEGAGALLDIINKDLGNIRLEPSANELGGVVVTAQTPQFQLQGEKKIFNVDQNLTSQGGTAADVMKNVPGVLVDADNKVTIRNAAPQVLIDGRQSPLTLDQIPSDAIESVEVITNPSAKYDAEGGKGGVLNIVLKKNRKKGYNGDLRAGVDSRGGGNLGGDFNIREGKFNVSFNGHSNLNRNLTYATTDRDDFFDNPDIKTHQHDVNKTHGAFAFGRIGLDYFITNRTTLSIGSMKVHGQFTPEDNIDITADSLLSTGDRFLWSRRNTAGKNMFDMNGGSFGVKHLFPRAGEEWTFDANVNAGKNSNDNRYTSDYFSDAEAQHLYLQQGQRTAGSGTNNFYTLQSDFSYPFANKSKLDVGVKATIRSITSTINNYITSPFTGADSLLANPNADYKNTDQVYAAYGSYSGNFTKDLSFQFGLRAENYLYNGELTQTGKTFTNNFPISLFPSVFIAQKLPQDQQLQFSYRRGVNRPNFFQLLPFTDYSDPLNIRQGNPGLAPEYTNSVEANYLKNFTRTNYVMASIYLRHSDHLITQYQQLGTNPFTGDPAIINSYINANTSDKYGVELTGQYALTKWWTVLANVNLYNAVLNTGDASNPNDGKNYFSGFGKLNNTIKLPWKLNLQVSGVYQGRSSLLPDNSSDGGRGGRGGMSGGGGFGMNVASSSQGYLDANWSVDAALRKSFLKNDAASLSLSVNDIFATRHFVQYTESQYFTQTYDRISNPYMLRLNFSWRFGKIDTDLFRRKNIKGAVEGMQDSAQGMGM